jgi:hypothetical protein
MLSRARASPNRRKLTVGGGPSRTRGQLSVDLRAEAAFLGPRGTRLCGCVRRCGGRFETLEIWGSTEEKGRWIERKATLGRMPEQLQGRRRGGKRLTRCNMCAVWWCVCACVCHLCEHSSGDAPRSPAGSPGARTRGAGLRAAAGGKPDEPREAHAASKIIIELVARRRPKATGTAHSHRRRRRA